MQDNVKRVAKDEYVLVGGAVLSRVLIFSVALNVLTVIKKNLPLNNAQNGLRYGSISRCLARSNRRWVFYEADARSCLCSKVTILTRKLLCNKYGESTLTKNPRKPSCTAMLA